MYEILIRIKKDEIIEKIFKSLEKEVVFHRGRIKIFDKGDQLEVRAYAADIASARSLANTILRVLYVIEGVEGL
ncbi:MAG: KEOPS complex subunit Pcc1 [Thermoproteus sp.]|jgi:tRNA threonylcarbamoyladenosine modification (KEOPS) complex  Pcc1 subunit